MYEPVTVILAEDSPDDEQLALRALRLSGIPMTVKVARDGERVLELLALDGSNQQRALPALVLCDLKLPKYNGSDVLAKVRANPRTASTPFVIFSSSDLDADVQLCVKLGANSYVRKPVDYDEFIAKVRQIAEYWLDTNFARRRGDFAELRISTPVGHLV